MSYIRKQAYLGEIGVLDNRNTKGLTPIKRRLKDLGKRKQSKAVLMLLRAKTQRGCLKPMAEKFRSSIQNIAENVYYEG